jgi:hypothetical protein
MSMRSRIPSVKNWDKQTCYELSERLVELLRQKTKMWALFQRCQMSRIADEKERHVLWRMRLQQKRLEQQRLNGTD